MNSRFAGFFIGQKDFEKGNKARWHRLLVDPCNLVTFCVADLQGFFIVKMSEENKSDYLKGAPEALKVQGIVWHDI